MSLEHKGNHVAESVAERFFVAESWYREVFFDPSCFAFSEVHANGDGMGMEYTKAIFGFDFASICFPVKAHLSYGARDPLRERRLHFSRRVPTSFLNASIFSFQRPLRVLQIPLALGRFCCFRLTYSELHG